MKRPLTGLVVVFAAGIWSATFLPWSPWLCWWATLGLLAVFCFVPRLPVLLALVFAAGALLLRDAVTPASHDLTRLVPYRDQNIQLRGVVVGDTGNDEETTRLRFPLRLSAAKITTDWQPVSGQVLVYAKPGEMPLRYGDEIECTAVLRVPATMRNPGTFDQRSWLARQRIAFVAVVGEWRVLAHGRGNPVTALALRLRDRLDRALRAGLEDEPELAGILTAIIIGSRSEIPATTYAEFQETGVFHIFSVSGLHVAIVALFVVGGLRVLQVPRRAAGLVAIPLLVLFVFATGARPGAVRSLLMACGWLLSWALVRPNDLPTNLAAAALAILIWEPLQLFDGGFVLSFGVVVALVVLTPLFERRLDGLRVVDPLVPDPLVPEWRKSAERQWTKCKQLACGSLAAGIGLLPMMAAYFHLFAPVSLVANLLVVPLVSVIMAVGMASLVAHPAWPWLAEMFNNANFLLLHVMLRSVAWLDRVPYGHVFVQEPPVWLSAAYYIGLVALLLWPARRLLVAGLGLTVVAVLLAVHFLREPAVEITVLDVPEGMAVFVNTPGERDDWLFDGGGGNSGERTVLPFLRAQGADRLGGMLLTVKDAAHVAGLNQLLPTLPPRAAVVADSAARSPTYWRWRTEINRRTIPVRTVHAGDQWEIRGLRITTLNPSPATTAQRSDDNSLVLALEYGPTRVLLLSDAGTTVERRLVESGADLRCAVLVKGGHGTELSATTELLAAARPAVVVQTVNEWPSRRHPDAALRQRVEARGARLLRTDETGAVTLRLTGKGYTLRTCLPAR
jgi:competence protein ComEC